MRPKLRALNALHTSRTARFSPVVQTPPLRPFTTARVSLSALELAQFQNPPPRHLDPRTVSSRNGEQKLLRSGVHPIGSRRRRAALRTSQNIPFEHLPYQCFQEARKILQQDRQDKIKQIETQRARIERLKKQGVGHLGNVAERENRLASMGKYLEDLKIWADINDPMVKKRFEDGQSDMTRPIYRYLANRKWRSRRLLVLNQRLTQMHIIPDVLPTISPTADVALLFAHSLVEPGEFVHSSVSAQPPKLSIQVFDKGERLVTVAVVDSDVPNLETDGFDSRCHFLAVNVPVTPISGGVSFQKLDAGEGSGEVVLPWLAPTAIKGSPYHRLSVLVLQQEGGDRKIDVAEAGGKFKRQGFSMRQLVQRYKLTPIGASLFRTQWDEGMDAVMAVIGDKSAEMELRRRRVEPLPYKKKDGARYR